MIPAVRAGRLEGGMGSGFFLEIGDGKCHAALGRLRNMAVIPGTTLLWSAWDTEQPPSRRPSTKPEQGGTAELCGLRGRPLT